MLIKKTTWEGKFKKTFKYKEQTNIESSICNDRKCINVSKI